ncbi:MAG: hypothetical protein CFE25_12440 [Chitinophagaceae bacterium BSSC1]|nr:MAG: hypothetical protein CFE25_12440 [Chitinophagaceae bacterium BSSC1]
MRKSFSIALVFCSILGTQLFAQPVNYVPAFANENHPQMGYWFISPNLLTETKEYQKHIDSIAENCKYTLIFLTAREGANFYDYPKMHPIFKDLVAAAHKKGLKVGLQLWGNYKDKNIEGSQRMIIETEVPLDQQGNAAAVVKAKWIRFPDRLLKSDLFKVYAFKKTGDGFYDPASLKDITKDCSYTLPDKETVDVKVKAGSDMKGMTVCIMTQQYCSQSSNWDNVETNTFAEAMRTYQDVGFDGFSLDEYGNKFVERIFELNTPNPFRGRWYSNGMAREYQKETGNDLVKTLFDGRYAPEGKPEVRINAINQYMQFMRKGGVRVEQAVYDSSRKIFGTQIFSGIHNTYHNSLINDEIWANGIGWWSAPRAYGHSDEKTFLPTQMGIAMAHPKNAFYNQYYDKDLEPVLVKSFNDLRYGVRTHYHAMNDKRPLRFDLEDADAVKGINANENCARLLNKFNPALPDIKLLVIFGMEGLSNWYPVVANRGVYDINDKMYIEERAVEIWKAGYLNALVPSDLIVNKQLVIGTDGKPVMNGHKFDAILYLNPQYAREPVLKFLEQYLAKGGKLMVEGQADRDFKGTLIPNRFKAIYDKATVVGYSVAGLAKLGLNKNLLPNGCRNEDGSYTFNDLNSMRTGTAASFEVNLNGAIYTGQYRGIVVIKTDKTGAIKLAATGLSELKKNGQPILQFETPVDVFVDKTGGQNKMTIADGQKKIKPLVSKF